MFFFSIEQILWPRVHTSKQKSAIAHSLPMQIFVAEMTLNDDLVKFDFMLIIFDPVF